jgi:pimeloyl-ACP methyl ester carboxylesterase
VTRSPRWDFRGHGRSDYPNDQDQYSLPLAVGDMVAILDAVRVEQAKVPDASRAVIPGAGHAPMISHPDEFHAPVRTLLERLNRE